MVNRNLSYTLSLSKYTDAKKREIKVLFTHKNPKNTLKNSSLYHLNINITLIKSLAREKLIHSPLGDIQHITS